MTDTSKARGRQAGLQTPPSDARWSQDDDGFVTALDLGGLIDLLFSGADPPARPNSADINHDCFYDALDLSGLIDFLFSGSKQIYWGCAG